MNKKGLNNEKKKMFKLNEMNTQHTTFRCSKTIVGKVRPWICSILQRYGENVSHIFESLLFEILRSFQSKI